MRAIAFVDYENIWLSLLERGYELTPERLVSLLQHYAVQINADMSAIFLYANFDREEFWRTQTLFEKTDVFTRHVFGKNNYTHTDLRRNAADSELMLEAQEILLTRPETFDVFLLFTGDGDFLPLVRKIRAWGKQVKVVGVDGSVHHALQPYCENLDVLKQLLQDAPGSDYDYTADLGRAIQVLGRLQLRLAYVASTRARAALSQELGRSMPRVKELIRYALREKVVQEREYPDSSLKIGRTKIYVLTLDDPRVKETLGQDWEEVRRKQEKLTSGH
ncbi:NYN domain, limkain-b1-type [Acididesulfobacillus acetoxydans]|uniref:NYN domain n=1 Tax=Acididesulfobacillus acetoxydans TaxID=1561005 RepID=A0A8S0Y2F3_9FIRM|nr:NYN domain-containing protein [Acididesulfobacillus acetoxydans]CAA7600735.1 NYN domain, limkain-b1-type [Acididesulfobacillus acetoxydans]CEJ06156.1 NYN domain [Acididesulfobacillus acetoxydans]